jgi:hypothetical protein
MEKVAPSKGVTVRFTDDKGLYAERLEKFTRGEYDIITLPINSYLEHGAKHQFPGVIVAAVGKRHVLTADMVKPGAVVLDVGMNRNEEGKLCGDVDFDGVKEVAGYITPVPGGVGPMTITMLLVNTLASAQRALSEKH